MDEPLGALDKTLRRGLQEELRSLHARLGVTIVFVTHDQEEALHLSDLLVVMDHGRIAQAGAPRKLYEAPATRFVAAFLGECNEIKRDGATYALRPERVRLASAAVTLAHRIEGCVEDVRFLGPSLRVVMQTSQGRFIALVAADDETSEIAVGQTITAGFRSQDLAELRG
jgi:putative spermidine/putrescine transport system ATP-binding protein